MKNVIILDHPYTLAGGNNESHHRSYSGALAKRTIEELEQRGQEVDLIDLHADKFDPVMHDEELQNWRKKEFVNAQAESYYERLKDADRIIFIFPIWWELMPAMTKGFLDKVLAKKLMKNGRKNIFPKQPTIRVFTVAGTPTVLYKWLFDKPVVKALYRGTFAKLGYRKFKWHNFNAEDQSPEKRVAELDNINKHLN